MNCSELARGLDLADIDARFDRSGATLHLSRCDACQERYPEIAALLGGTHGDDRARTPRSGFAGFTAAAALLIGVALSLIARRPGVDPPQATTGAPEAVGVRHLPTSASTVRYTSRRLVAAGDPRAFESVVVRGGVRRDPVAASHGRLR